MAVLVTYYGHANSFWQPAASSGVMGRDAQLVLEARVGEDWLVTDERWRVLRSRAWRGAGRWSGRWKGLPIELLDARELDPFWMDADFDDSSWVEATVLKASHDGALGESRPPVDPYGAMLPRGIGMLGGSRVVAPSVIMQNAPRRSRTCRTIPPSGWSGSYGTPATKRTVQLPLTVARSQDAATLVTVELRPDRRRPRRAGGRGPAWCAAGPVLPGVRGLRCCRRPGRLRTPQQRQLHHPRLRRPLQGRRHQRAAADLPADPAGQPARSPSATLR